MTPSSSSQGVWFPQWAELLSQANLKDLERCTFRLAIGEYLKFCKQSRQRATVASAREFMQHVEARNRLGRSQLAAWKAGLNWFFQTARAAVLRPATRLNGNFHFYRPKEPPLIHPPTQALRQLQPGGCADPARGVLLERQASGDVGMWWQPCDEEHISPRQPGVRERQHPCFIKTADFPRVAANNLQILCATTWRSTLSIAMSGKHSCTKTLRNSDVWEAFMDS